MKSHGKASKLSSLLTAGNILFAVAILAVFVVTIYIRIPLLQYQGFYEPDGFYHFSVIRAAVLHGFSIPHYLSISGWPASTLVAEPFGMYWVTLVPYAFLQYFGVSYYTVMRLVPLLFALLDVVGAYVLARFISKDRVFGLLVMAFVGLSAGDAARTSALIYRGDGFVTIFLILALIFMGLILNEKRRKKLLIYAFLAGLSLSVGSLVWNGSSFAVAIYVLAFVLIAAYAFIADKEDLLDKMKYVLIGMVVWFVLSWLYVATGSMLSQTLMSPDFLGIVAIGAIGWYLFKWLLKNKSRYQVALTGLGRLTILIALIAVGVVVFYVAAYGFIYNIFVANGFVITSSFAATIQELTPPTFSFLFASFNITLFMSPMTIIIALSSMVGGSAVILWIVLLFGFLPYLLMRVYDSKGWLGGSARLSFDVKPEIFMLVAYFALTALLQMSAIRFNSLVSIPLAIFSAYTLYWILLIVKKLTDSDTRIIFYSIAAVLLVIILIVMFYYDTQYGSFSQADFINPLFLNATVWLKNNTPSNSVVLTLWPDGSVVEGWGNRTSVTDSVGSQNPAKADPFATWLLNSSNDPAFLESSINGKPNYLLVRNIWLEESQGIFIESYLNSSMAQYYGYGPLTSIFESANGSALDFRFSGSGVNAYVYTENGIAGDSFLTFNSTAGQQAISPLSYTAFYNQNTGNFTVQPNLAYNKTNGELLLVIYSGVQNPKLPLNITSVAVFASGMSDSNMLKFIYFCNNYQCLWNYNNTVAKLSLVYMNPDTKIFKITYLNGTQGAPSASNNIVPNTTSSNSSSGTTSNAIKVSAASNVLVVNSITNNSASNSVTSNSVGSK